MRAEATLKRLAAWLRRGFAQRGAGKSSLVGRLLSILLVCAVLMYLVVNVGLWWSSTRLLRDSFEKQALNWVKELDELGTPLYVSRGRHADIAQRLHNFPEISFVRYFDASGKQLLGGYNREPHDAPKLTDEQIGMLRALADADTPYLIEHDFMGGAYLRVLAPVRIKSIPTDGLFGMRLNAARAEDVKVIGFIDLGLDARHYRDDLIRSFLWGNAVVALLFLVVLVGGRHAIRRALAPLTELEAPLARLANGDVEVQVHSTGHREIAAISDALNATARALRARDEQLRRLAEHDGLTGLVNRAHFARILDLEIARLKQTGGESALYFVDLDEFKHVNDTLGHAAGDQLLVQVADLLRARLRDNDVIARFGGDEFTVLARDVTRQAAVEIARSINRLICDARLIEGDRVFQVGCSIGITMVGAGNYLRDELFSQADAACYAAKSAGRNRCQMYEPGAEDRKRLSSDDNWLQIIQQSMDDDRFRLVYQPIASIAPRDREFYEVLLRMRRGSDTVLPAVFLPVAQRFGLLADIDRWVIRRAFRELAAAREHGRDVVFSINLSGASFEEPTLLEFVRHELERHRLPGEAVVFEITEQTAVRYFERANHVIRGLIALGCRLALDDFGNGLSSVGYLKHLPVDIIKIDGAVVCHISKDAADQTMVRAMIEIAHTLGKLSIAKFVQDEETLELLRLSGVDFAQGYHIGRPSEQLAQRLPQTSVPGRDARRIGSSTH